MAAGLAGGAWGVAADPAAPAALALAGAAIAGGLCALRVPGLACAILFAAGAVGAVVVGAAWLGPCVLQIGGAVLALAAAPNPFAAEIAAERAAAPRDRRRPG
jgi:hypothetical protein